MIQAFHFAYIASYSAVPSFIWLIHLSFDLFLPSLSIDPRKIDRRSFTIIDPQTHQPANDFYPTLCDTNHKAAVYLAEEKDGEMIVLKTSHNPEDMEQEIGAMTSLTTPHPNVMHMIGIVFELTAAKTWVSGSDGVTQQVNSIAAIAIFIMTGVV